LPEKNSSWIQNYSIKFDGCAAVPRFEREEGFTSDLLAKFKLCPSNSCNSCRNAGEYIVDMRELIEAYQEAKQQANEQVCESAQESCEYQCQNNNNGNDDQSCEYQCLSDQGLSYCADDEAEEGMDMNEIGECRALNEDDQNNNNGYYNSDYQIYYVGAYCTSKGVFAGTFTDSACTNKAPRGTYEKLNYGYSLPTEALVPKGCIGDCQATTDDDANAAYISEFCEDLYDQAAKCEKKVKNIQYQDNSGCELIHEILPKMNNAFNQIAGKSSHAAAIWAWIFGISCVFLGGYIYLLHKRVIREKVDMSTLGLV
jgi:hypothetical protein